MWREAAVIDVPVELMCSAKKDTDPPRNVDEVAAWKLALSTRLWDYEDRVISGGSNMVHKRKTLWMWKYIYTKLIFGLDYVYDYKILFCFLLDTKFKVGLREILSSITKTRFSDWYKT